MKSVSKDEKKSFSSDLKVVSGSQLGTIFFSPGGYFWLSQFTRDGLE
jgi:hypothetical protein